MTRRAPGVTTSRSGPMAPWATSRACSCSIATAGTSWRIRQSAVLMSSPSSTLLGADEHFRQPDAWRVVGDDCERRIGSVRRSTRADPAVEGVAEARKTAHSLAQRKLERRNGGQLGTERQCTRAYRCPSDRGFAAARQHRRGSPRLGARAWGPRLAPYHLCYCRFCRDARTVPPGQIVAKSLRD